jgi:penicillin-binding protein 2
MIVFDQLKKNDLQLQLLAVLVCLGIVLLLSGLWWVQIVNASNYRARVETQSYRTVRVPAVRGKILDRTGVALAENRPSYNVGLYLEELSPQFRAEYRAIRPKQVVTNELPFWKSWLGISPVQTQYVRMSRAQTDATIHAARHRVVQRVADQVAVVLQTPLPVNPTNFQRHYAIARAMPFPLANNLTPELVARFEERAINSLGVDLEIEFQRQYPFGSTAAHVLGYVRSETSSVEGEDSYYSHPLPTYRGLVGIEGGFDKELRGLPGMKSVLVNNLGYRQTETVWEQTVAGQNVVLTLDAEVQRATEKALQAKIGSNGRGAVVVLEVHSGDILALASQPTSDPNAFIRRFTPAELARWKDEQLGVQKNRATAEQYQPGSIFKTIIALAALENGISEQQIVNVRPHPNYPWRGAYFLGRSVINDTAPHGEYDLRRAIVRSSNSYFIEMGLRPGVFERVIELGRRLHLGERINLPLRQEAAGNFPRAGSERDWNPRYKANICMGQGAMDVTPLQMAVMTAALANGGKVLYPRIVDRLESADHAARTPPTRELSREGTPVIFPPGRVRNHLGVSPRHMTILHEAMLAETEDTADGATGQYARVEGLRICGKTGTAEREQRGPDGRKRNTTWFASFAPYERPQFAVVVMVEDGESGGRTCAPIARDVYQALVAMSQRTQNFAHTPRTP